MCARPRGFQIIIREQVAFPGVSGRVGGGRRGPEIFFKNLSRPPCAGRVVLIYYALVRHPRVRPAARRKSILEDEEVLKSADRKGDPEGSPGRDAEHECKTGFVWCPAARKGRQR